MQNKNPEVKASAETISSVLASPSSTPSPSRAGRKARKNWERPVLEVSSIRAVEPGMELEHRNPAPGSGGNPESSGTEPARA